MVLSFFMGICTVGRYNGGYVNISEYVHTKYKDAVSTLLLVFEQLALIIIVLYFKFILTYWRPLQVVGVILTVISIVGCYFIPESPEYAYSFYNFKATKRAFQYIGRFNKVKFN